VQEILGTDWAENNKGQNFGLIKFLLNRGYSEEDILGCARYIKHEKMVRAHDMRRIRNVIASWISAGRPEKPASHREVVRVGRAKDYGPPASKITGI